MRCVAVGLLLVVTGGVGCSRADHTDTEPQSPIDTADATEASIDWDEIALADLQGRVVTLGEHAGSIGTVVILMRTDCPIGNRYAPTLIELAGRYEPAELTFVSVYPIRDETAEEIRSHQLEYRLPGVPLRDPEWLLVDRLDAEVTPEVAVFDRSWKLVYQGRIDDRFVDFGEARTVITCHELNDVLSQLAEGIVVDVEWTNAVGCPIRSR